MKAVLVISPTPTHAGTAGNRLHIKSLIDFFKEQDCKVDFLYLQYEDFDKEAMNSFLENRLEVLPREMLFLNKKTLTYLFRKMSTVAKKLYRQLQFKSGKISSEQLQYNAEVDSFFPHFASGIIRQRAASKKYDMVVCEYAAMSKSLDFFGSDVFKILDTHDVFTNRFNVYLDNNLKPEWVSLYQSEEKKALLRADLVLAVLEQDKDFFKTLGVKKVEIFNALPAMVKRPRKNFEHKLLYIASGNDINLATIEYFVKEIFPFVVKDFPAVQLLIGGGICDKYQTTHPNVLLCGKFKDLQDFYSLGDIVINPETSGTGYKVKALEALAHGMALVTTPAGAMGAFEQTSKKHLCLANSVHDFPGIIGQLFQNPGKIDALSQEAHLWITERKQTMVANLQKALA